LLYNKYSNVQFDKYISTILKLFIDEDLLTPEFLVEWDKDALEGLKNHFLFNSENNERFKTAAHDILEWLK